MRHFRRSMCARNHRSRGDLIRQKKLHGGSPMTMDQSKAKTEPTARGPMVVAAVVAGVGMLGLLLVDHGPWSTPKVQTAEVHNYSTTGEAARAVDATVAPTEPRSE